MLMKRVSCTSASALLAAVGAFSSAALAQPVLDGKLDPHYGPAQWFQTAPTNFGDAAPPLACIPIGLGVQVGLNNTNRAGVVGSFPVVAADQTAAAAVTTGFEIKIPLSELGSPATIRIAGFVASGNYSNFSSQVIGGINANTTLGGYPSTAVVDLTIDTRDQFVTVPATVPVGTPTIDGSLDAAFYGAPLFVQDTTTNYGDSNAAVVPADSIYKAPGGSEIDAVYARRTATDLYVFIAGNLESNFNKLAIFFDTGAANAQNVLLNTNFNNGGITDGGANAMAGLKFDTAFSANYFLSCTVGGGPETLFVDFQKLGTEAQGGATRSLNPAGATVNPYIAQACPPPPGPDPDTAGGSEIDGLYATVCGNFLYLFVPGNLETNGNWIDLFFDVGTTNVPVPGSTGQNRILPSNVTVGDGALQRMAEDPLNAFFAPGLRFSPGFDADYYISFRNSGLPVDVFAIAANMNTNGALNDGLPIGTPPRPSLFEYGSFVGGPKATNNPLSFDGQFCVRPVPVVTNCTANGISTFWNPLGVPGIDIQGDASGAANNPTLIPVLPDIFSSFAPRLISANAFDPLNRGTPSNPVANPNSLAQPGLLRIAIDNSNRGGVTGSSAALASTVTTGIEVRVRLDELGYSGTGPIKVAGWINGGGHDFISNQVIGGQLGANQGNLGEPRAVDFPTNIIGTGPFYVTIIPGNCAPAPTGACCFANNTVCSIMSAPQCVAASGLYAGDNRVCASSCGNQPASGRCCIGARCTIVVDSAACNALLGGAAGAVFSAGVTTCNATGNFTAPCCYANYNKVGGITVQDIFDFLSGWFANSPNANVEGTGAIPTVQDIFDFLAAWFSGGCT